MIKSFKDKATENVFNQYFSRKFPVNIQQIALRKLELIDNANNIMDLRSPPGNRLEQLRGNRKGQWSIRINQQYRICFVLKNTNDFLNVEITKHYK